MHLPCDHEGSLLTPSIIDVGVNKVNPIFTSSDFLSLDDNNIHCSSTTPKWDEYEFPPMKDNSDENSDNIEQQQYDLFSTLEFPVLSELDQTEIELQMSLQELENYFDQPSAPSSPIDTHDSVLRDDSTIWVGEECTIGTEHTNDMMVPPSPSLSSVSSSSAMFGQQSTKRSKLTITERKLRKKDQNKTAAEKYRKKKQAERNELLQQHAALQSQNEELKSQLRYFTNHIESLKELFVNVLQIPIPPSESK